MKNIQPSFLYRKFPLLLLCLSLFIVSSCQAGEEKTKSFKTRLEGVLNGQINLVTRCININGYSARVVFKDVEQELRIYAGVNCDKTTVLLTKTISVESQFSGIWNDHAILDEGTDVNSRDLHLIKINKPHVIHSFSYELRPVFKSKQIIYYEPLEKEAKPADCLAEQKVELKEWQRSHLGIGLAREMVFDLLSKKRDATGVVKCFPMQ